MRIFSVGLVSLLACSNPPPAFMTDGGDYDFARNRDSGTDGGTTMHDLSAPNFDGGLINQAGGPTIVVTSPTAGAEVPYDTLNVSATITSPTGTPIDVSTVSLSVPVAGGTAQMSLTGSNTFTGAIDISALSSMPSKLRVQAADINGLTSTVEVAFTHDHGPVLDITSPSAATVKGAISIQIVITDDLHAINTASLQVGIRAINDVTGLTITPGTGNTVVAAGTVNLAAYSPPLDGSQLLRAQVAAQNGTIGRATQAFTVDNSGPTIVIVSPGAGNFVGGVIDITATIDDTSGVNDSTVLAVLGGSLSNAVSLVHTTGSTYTGQFDIRSLGTSYVSPTLSVRADDSLGNHAEEAIEIIVDNTPPIIDLDPPLIRVSQDDGAGGRECSQQFDPVGAESANDGQVVKQVVSLKARVEDRANDAPGLLVPRVSGIDSSTVTLWITPATSGAILVVDSNGDGICDDINPLIAPTGNINGSNQAVTVAMGQLALGGTPDFTAGSGIDPPAVCTEYGSATITTPPAPLCPDSGTQMTFVLPYLADGEPTIWSIPPITTGPADCIGLQFDTLNHIPEGPACVAVRAVDHAGNQGVSAPLRVCIDRGGGMCGSFTTPFPNCSGTYDRIAGTVATSPCTSVKFPGGEVRALN